MNTVVFAIPFTTGTSFRQLSTAVPGPETIPSGACSTIGTQVSIIPL